MTQGKALLGVLAGMAAGATLGLLFAPRKGSEFRSNMYRKGDDLASALSDRVEEKFEELIGLVRAGQRKTDKEPAEKKS